MDDSIKLLNGITNFLKDNTTFGSSVALEQTLDKLETVKTLNEALLVPISHKMINLDGALKFLFFLHVTAPDALKDDDSSMKPDLDFKKAFDDLARVYDMGVQDLVDLLNVEDSDDEDDDEEESESEDEDN